MSSKSTMFITLCALAITCGAGPTKANAQGNRGELVAATAKLNQAQMALVKRLADDAAFADQFNAATSKGNAAAVADLVSKATGVSKASIAVQGSVGTAAETTRNDGLFHVAAIRSTSKPMPITSGEICFDFGRVRGCISW
jgi:hypothetical protein